MKTISGKAFCKFLEQNGWELQRIRGSHCIYTKPGVVKISTKCLKNCLKNVLIIEKF
jgi:predicted RNA binding protein YcfA (HicA-like mRNA interferase family)